MTSADEIADFVQTVSYSQFSEEVIEELKKRILDSIGIAVGAIGKKPVEMVRETVHEMDGEGCTVWGSGKEVSPEQAAMMNTALTRYLDFMDSFLAPGETPHPSDNIASAVVCGEYNNCSGKELIEAVGVAYEIQAMLAWNAPVRDRGWDHVTHTIFSATAAASKMLELGKEKTRSAIAIAGTAHNALRVTRTGEITMWKGIASANTARNAVYSALLAKNGVEGPRDVFNGEKGWKHIVSGEFDGDLSTGCESVKRVMTKKYVAETYAQSAVEGLLELIEEEGIDAHNIRSIELETFHGAYQIIGGGEGGDRYSVRDKEQADHSLPYMLAVAALDGELFNAQYEQERIERDDVQELLRKVKVSEDEKLTERFESGEMPAVLDVELESGETFHVEKSSFEGHPNNSASWQQIEDKFHAMTEEFYSKERREGIVEAVESLEKISVRDLVKLLGEE
ncbi:MAG: MmgE/PrpD family protein [Candidatus Nanohaloarchaea archaeon]|nr:MmgE/PrpD family protein [Candidatus Nanohaloarchaea archaeon]